MPFWSTYRTPAEYRALRARRVAYGNQLVAKGVMRDSRKFSDLMSRKFC